MKKVIKYLLGNLKVDYDGMWGSSLESLIYRGIKEDYKDVSFIQYVIEHSKDKKSTMKYICESFNEPEYLKSMAEKIKNYINS